MNSEFRYRGYWIPFPKPVPAVVGTAWNDGDLRTICISSEWLPYVLGALQVLCRRETYYGDPDDIEFSVEQANHILAGWRDECPMPIMFQQSTPCLLEYSLDGGTTWTGMYNGQLCINENIADGTLAAGTTANKSEQPPPAGCLTYYIQVQEQTDYVLPTTVSSGDVITVSDVSGAWADGWVGNLWYCYDGSSFILGICVSGSNPAKAGDPLSTAQHQQLIMKVGSTYIDCLLGAYTVPAGVSNALISFLPNNGSARSGGTGVVAAKVTVCNNSSWCRVIDFTASDGGFTAVPFSPTLGTYVTSNGWVTTLASGNDDIWIQHTIVAGETLQQISIEYTRTGPLTSSALYFATKSDASDSFGSTTLSSGVQTYTWTGSQVVSSDAKIQIYTQAQHGTGSGTVIRKITIRGTGSNPFGSDNCP